MVLGTDLKFSNSSCHLGTPSKAWGVEGLRFLGRAELELMERFVLYCSSSLGEAGSVCDVDVSSSIVGAS